MNSFENPMGRILRRRDPRRLEGMTLVEIMIVVIIMALIATAVGVAVLPRLKQARVDSTRADAQTVSSGVQMYVADNPGGDCPSMDDLTSGGYINSSTRTADAWDGEFVIDCQGDDVTVTSSGPDRQLGTEDDISTARD